MSDVNGRYGVASTAPQRSADTTVDQETITAAADDQETITVAFDVPTSNPISEALLNLFESDRLYYTQDEYLINKFRSFLKFNVVRTRGLIIEVLSKHPDDVFVFTGSENRLVRPEPISIGT
jgi:hypothetical protein